MVLKSYAWFDGTPENINQTVKYFSEERLFVAGKSAIHACFRRSGVIAGYIIHRNAANAAATDRYDGTLYYQMYLTASVLTKMDAITTPTVLVLCRNGEPPDFGNSETERGKYVPGRFTAQARVNMIGGVISILNDLKSDGGVDVVDEIMHDYANYFYPCIKDQLRLSVRDYWTLYRNFGRMGFDRYPMFHVYSITCFLLGERWFDRVVRSVRALLGRSPNFGSVMKLH
jgi:hypothetical protein